MNHLTSLTASTHLTVFYFGSTLATGIVFEGTTAIAATSTNIICTAVTLDAEHITPTFAIPLRGVRFNPAPGSQE